MILSTLGEVVVGKVSLTRRKSSLLLIVGRR
jgi:hypothetical protein